MRVVVQIRKVYGPDDGPEIGGDGLPLGGAVDEAERRAVAAATTAFKRISAERWRQVRKRQSLVNWECRSGAESFALGEEIFGWLHTHFVRIGRGRAARYFEANKPVYTPHEVLVAECLVLMADA